MHQQSGLIRVNKRLQSPRKKKRCRGKSKLINSVICQLRCVSLEMVTVNYGLARRSLHRKHSRWHFTHAECLDWY